ncbi:hypothetical protein [Vogesella mureinivorans]|nr:hypothetical protein [Vogesella mureinivorans]
MLAYLPQLQSAGVQQGEGIGHGDLGMKRLAAQAGGPVYLTA